MRNVVFGALVGFMLGTFFGLFSTKYGLVVRVPVIEVAENEPIEAITKSNQNETERLPSGIVASTTDLFLRRLWGHPDEDLPFKPKYLVTFTVGLNQKDLVKTAVSKFSKNWTIVLFHYDGRVNEWEEFEWSHRAIHISARKQSKWWFAKRFLHPDVVSPFEYIFVWDEDLDLDHFDAEEYINLVKKHGLEISQPGLDPYKHVQWRLTQRLENSEVHRVVKEMPDVCPDPLKPPCAGFVEIMAPVFSRSSWHCVWRLIQNDLVHGWGLDFFMGRCVEVQCLYCLNADGS